MMNLYSVNIKTLLLILSVSLLPVLLYSCDSSSENNVKDREAIRTALEDWTKDFNDKNTDKVCGLFAKDLIANYGDYPEISYESICTQLKSSLTNKKLSYNYALNIQEIIVSGDLAVVKLIWTLVVSDYNGKSIETVKDRGIDIFKRQSDGSWKISRYIAYPSSV